VKVWHISRIFIMLEENDLINFGRTKKKNIKLVFWFLTRSCSPVTDCILMCCHFVILSLSLCMRMCMFIC